jgi:hypothetical protein
VSASAETPAEFHLGLRQWLMLIGVMLALILEILDSSIVNVALPSMQRSLNASATDLRWYESTTLRSSGLPTNWRKRGARSPRNSTSRSGN